MTQIPTDELIALGTEFLRCGSEIEEELPMVCELGNKKNSTGLYRDFYVRYGYPYVCLDWNGLDGAVPLNFNYQIESEEIDKIGGPFQWVTNFGFTEHVEDQLKCWYNVNQLVAIGGRLVFCMPQLPYWRGHGLWQPDIGWYDMFARLNGYTVELLESFGHRKRPTITGRFKKLSAVEFQMPVGGIHDARGR